MKLQIVKASVSQIITVFIQDSSQTDGRGLGSLDQTSSIVGGYVRAGGTGVALAVDENVTTEGTYEAPSTAAQVRIGTPANMTSGTYELHFHNDLFAAGADSVFITLGGASNMAVIVIEIQLTDFDLNAVGGDAPATQDQVDSIGAASGGSVNINISEDNTTTDTIDNAAAVDKGDGLVGIPVTGHAFIAGREVTIAGTVNYNGAFAIISQTANEVVITDTFVSETFAGSETIVSSIKGEVFVGSVQSGTFASLEAADGVVHDIDDAGPNDIDIVYGASVGGGRTASEVSILANVSGNADEIKVKAFDHVGSDWEIIGTVEGSGGTTFKALDLPLLLKHTGTGSELGKTYVRFETDSTTPSNLSIDKVLVKAVNIGQSVGYANGRIWVDTVNGVAGTEPFVNGVADNAVLTLADAKTLSGNSAVNLMDFHIINGSTITLAESTVNESYFGDNWTLALNDQDVDGAYFQGAHVTGVGTSATEVHYEGCDVGTMSVQRGHFDFCAFSGTVTMTLAGDYEFHNCYSNVPGVGAPTFTKTAGQAITAEWRNWMDSITSSGLQSGDTTTINGRLGTVTLNGADATVEIRGSYKSIVNNLTGSPAVNKDGAWKGADIAATLVGTFGSAYSGPRGPGVYYDDAAANTNTVDGTDGTWSNHVSTPTAVKTLLDSLGLNRVYIVNNSSFTPPEAMEDCEFVAIGEMSANTVNFGSQDLDRSVVWNALLTGAQGGTGRVQAEGCVLSSITEMEITALECLLAAGTLTVRNDCMLNACWSAVAGSGTPIVDINSVAGVNLYNRHYSGGWQVNNAVATTVMSHEADGQIIVDATCTGLTAVVRGNCSITDNGATTNLTQDAAISRTGVRSAIGLATANLDTQLGDIPTTAEFEARTLVASAYALAAVCTEARLAELDAANLPSDIAAIPTTAMRGTEGAALASVWTVARAGALTDWINGGRLDLILDDILAMLDDPRAEPGQGAPAVNPDAMTKLDYLYKDWRNKKTQTATQYNVYDDAGTTIDQKSTVSDDGTTATKGEMATGP